MKYKKSLGQNFLTDKNVIKKIVNLAKINNKIIFEIGPGLGSLTQEILEKNPNFFLGIEKDNKLFDTLLNNFSNFKNSNFINDDALYVDEKKYVPKEKKAVVFGNLPYNISTQILIKWIRSVDWPPWYEKLILMFQKEVGERIIANKNSKNYGRLSIISNWRLNITKNFDVSKNCFFPRPKVDSMVLTFEPKKNFIKLKNPKNLEKITEIMFSSRRKMIKNSILKLFKKNDLIEKEFGIDLQLRPENLDKEIFYKLASKYENLLR